MMVAWEMLEVLAMLVFKATICASRARLAWVPGFQLRKAQLVAPGAGYAAEDDTKSC